MMMMSDLPTDLEAEILSRVPTKSLTRLKTICKRWYALLRDPRFVEKNKKMCKAVRETLLLDNQEVYSIAGDLHNSDIDTPIELTGKLTSLKGSKDLSISQIYHCDSLMLCSTEGNTRLVIWNPCTGQKTNIKPRTCYGSEDTYAFGYSTSSSSDHSYKILRCFYNQNEQTRWVAEGQIYDLSSDSWRVLDSIPSGYSVVYCNGVSLKGDTYFVDNKTCAFLTKFDFTTETFVRVIPLPFQILDLEDTVLLSVVRDEKLSLLYIDDVSGLMRIWVTNKIDEDANEDLSWRSDLVLEVGFDSSNMYVESFLLDEENKAAVMSCVVDLEDDYNETRIYIVGEGMFKQVYEDTTSPLNFPVILTYVPSLVQIQTPKRQEKQRG